MERERAQAIAGVDEAAARRVAAVLIEGFDKHYRLFRAASGLARQRFEEGKWAALQYAMRERIKFYDERVLECVERLRGEFDLGALSDETWREAKLHYIGLLVEHGQPELAETFFNSVITRILQRTYYDNDLIFVRPAISTEYIEPDPPIVRGYYPHIDGERECFARLFRDFGWRRPFADLDRDVEHVLRALAERPGGHWTHLEPNYQIQVLGSAFYRNKAAYVFGKLVNGHQELPFVVPVLHDAGGRLEVDAILLDPQQINVLFSLSRAYFMVEMEVPSGYVRFLRSMTPHRAPSELYTMLGLGKQGKTEFVPRAAPPPAPLARPVRRGARDPRPGDARLRAPLVPVRLQGDPRRVRAREGHRPRDRPLEVRDGQARRPGRAPRRHARVRRAGAAARALLGRSCSSSCRSWRRRWSPPTTRS